MATTTKPPIKAAIEAAIQRMPLPPRADIPVDMPCLKCGGRLHFYTDRYGTCLSCFNCGRDYELDELLHTHQDDY